MQKNAEVAEILGAFTGDGWIESRGGALYICGHSIDDKGYYDNHLGPLFSKYFTEVRPNTFHIGTFMEFVPIKPKSSIELLN